MIRHPELISSLRQAGLNVVIAVALIALGFWIVGMPEAVIAPYLWRIGLLVAVVTIFRLDSLLAFLLFSIVSLSLMTGGDLGETWVWLPVYFAGAIVACLEWLQAHWSD